MSPKQLKSFLISSVFGLLLTAALPSLSYAQELTDQSSTRQITPTPSNFLVFAQELVQIAETQNGDCDAMLSALKASIERHRPMLLRIDYATENADDDTIRSIHEAAQSLGQEAAKCYENAELADLLESLTAL